jgi:hypothetical protein
MKSTACLLLLSALALPAQAAKSCEDLKAEIAAKIEANGVKVFTLEVVPSEQVQADQKVVGSCGGGRNKIVYKRGQQV